MANCIFTSATPTAEYTLPYNPYAYPMPGDYNLKESPILHGAPAWHDVKFDSRLRTFAWRGNRVDDNSMDNMINILKSKIGMTYYINFQDLDAANIMWPTSDTWKKVRIINIKTTIRPGGPLVYDRVELLIQPEE